MEESAGTLKMIDWPHQCLCVNPIEQVWGELENKLDRSIVHSKESLWLHFQKEWDNMSVKVFRKYVDTMPEICAFGHQILKLRVDKNSLTRFI